MRLLPLFSPSQGSPFFMTYNIDEYSREETLCEGTPENYLVGLTKPTVDKILESDNPCDALALYSFYCYVSKWQGNNSVYAVSDYCMTKLNIGRDRFHKAKQTLIDLELIEDDPRYNHESKRMGKWYIRIRHISGATLRKSYSVDFQQGRKTDHSNQRVIEELPENNKKKPETRYQTKKEADATSSVPKPRKVKLVDDQFIAELKTLNPEINIDAELRKMDTWLLAHPERKKTRPFVTGWINRQSSKLIESKKDTRLPNGEIDWANVKPNM